MRAAAGLVTDLRRRRDCSDAACKAESDAAPVPPGVDGADAIAAGWSSKASMPVPYSGRRWCPPGAEEELGVHRN